MNKQRINLSELITLVCTLLLIVLWGYAAFSKLANYSRFVEQMQLAPVPLMKHLAPFLGIAVPVAELSLVVMLFTERFKVTGLWLSFFLLLSFTIYISIMLMSGLHLPCTCGGLISRLGWRQHLFFNLFFMLVALFPIIWQRISPSVYSPRSIYK